MRILKLRTGTLLHDASLELLTRVDATDIRVGYNCVAFRHTAPPRDIIARLNDAGGWFTLADLRPTYFRGLRRNLHFAAMDFGLSPDWASVRIHGLDFLINKADSYSYAAHLGQVRKHSGEPYIVHPRAVAQFLLSGGNIDAPTIAGALLHDVVEDTPRTKEDIAREFGQDIAAIVDGCSMVSKKTDGNRAARKKIDLEHYAAGDERSQTIKLADFIHNAPNLFVAEPTFFPTFLSEKEELVSRLTRANSVVRACAHITIDFYKSAMTP